MYDADGADGPLTAYEECLLSGLSGCDFEVCVMDAVERCRKSDRDAMEVTRCH